MAREDNGIMTDLSSLPDGQYQVTNWGKPTPLNVPAQRSTMFGPGVPVMPVNPLEKPRVFEYRPGINLVIIPRYGYGLADFNLLRNLALACKEVRLNIELIKREVRSLEYEIIPSGKNDKGDYGQDIAEVVSLLEHPDGQMDFDSWMNAMLEEVLVTDALTIFPEMTRGKLTSLDLIDGSKIRPVLDYRGKIAAPPAPGYMQVLYGQPAGSWTTDELIYRPMNASVNSPYGTSPIEFFMLVVNLALRRDSYHLGYFTEGNVPEALVGAPATWTQSQIDTWQQYWDALVAGNTSEQRRMHWIPTIGTGSNLPVYEFKRDNVDNTTQDEWLMKVACWAFGNAPQEFGLTSGQGLGGTGYAGAMADVHQRSMIQPVTQYTSKILTRIIQHNMRKPWLRFKWLGLDPNEDFLQKAQVDQIYLATGVYDTGYIQERDGIPPDHRPAAAPAEAPDEEPGLAKFFRGQRRDWQAYP